MTVEIWRMLVIHLQLQEHCACKNKSIEWFESAPYAVAMFRAMLWIYYYACFKFSGDYYSYISFASQLRRCPSSLGKHQSPGCRRDLCGSISQRLCCHFERHGGTMFYLSINEDHHRRITRVYLEECGVPALPIVVFPTAECSNMAFLRHLDRPVRCCNFLFSRTRSRLWSDSDGALDDIQ